MNLYELLHRDHKEISALFASLSQTEEKDLGKRTHLFEKLKEKLTVHAKAEEKFFYSAIKDLSKSHKITLEALEEHKVVKRLLQELDLNNKDRDEWMAKLTVLQENVEHHVKEEEGDLFKKAKEVLSPEETQAIAISIKEFKEEYASALTKI